MCLDVLFISAFYSIIISKVKVAAEVKTAKDYAVFSAICYKLQIVEGTNYFIKVVAETTVWNLDFNFDLVFWYLLYALFLKVHVGDSECLHLHVFAPLPCYGGGMKLEGIQEDKALDDPIVFF